MFAVRDTLTGIGRYYLATFGLGPLWFIPEFATLPVFALFVWRWAVQRQSIFAAVLSVNTMTAVAVSIVYMSWTPFQIVSSVKMFLPLFVGLMMAQRNITEGSRARLWLGIAFSLSLIGLLLSPLFEYPWVGQSIDNFGVTRQLTRVWWIGQRVRHSGFATDSTMAAFMTVFVYLLLFRHLSRWLNLLLLFPLFFAVHLSTSRTVMMVLILFTAYYILTEFIVPRWRSVAFDRTMARWSFVSLLAPFALIVLLSNVDLTEISPSFFSMQDRINNSWQLPFLHLAERFPIGLVFGCGLGCYAYPMEYTALAAEWVPVDNFYLISYLMLGAPFLIVLAGMFLAAGKTQDRDKLILIAALNIYLTTVAGYGPSFSPLLVGYAFSNLVLVSSPRWRRLDRMQKAPVMLAHQPPALPPPYVRK